MNWGPRARHILGGALFRPSASAYLGGTQLQARHTHTYFPHNKCWAPMAARTRWRPGWGTLSGPPAAFEKAFPSIALPCTCTAAAAAKLGGRTLTLTQPVQLSCPHDVSALLTWNDSPCISTRPHAWHRAVHVALASAQPLLHGSVLGVLPCMRTAIAK